MNENKELIEKSATITADPVTGMRKVIDKQPQVNITEEDIDKYFKEGNGSLSSLVEEKIFSNEAKELTDDALTLASLIRGMKDGSNKRPRFHQLPKNIQDMIRSNVGNNPKTLQEFTNAFLEQQKADMEKELTNQVFTYEDIDSGESKPYSEMIKDQNELFEAFKEDESKSHIFDIYDDAVNFKTIEKYAEKRLPKLNKKYKRLEYLAKYYKHIYNDKRVSTSTLDVTNIPIILERIMRINDKSFEPIVYDYFLLIYLNYIYENSLDSDKLEDHIYISISTKSIFDLDYLRLDDEVYVERVEILSRILDKIQTNYL